VAKANRVSHLLDRLSVRVELPLDDAWCQHWAPHDSPYYPATLERRDEDAPALYSDPLPASADPHTTEETDHA
jgi:hypothetical protein